MVQCLSCLQLGLLSCSCLSMWYEQTSSGADTWSMLVCWTCHACNVSHDAREQISFGPISWLMVGEVFPLAVRGQASALATMTNFASNFAVRWHAQVVSAATACQRARILTSFHVLLPLCKPGLRIPPMVSAATACLCKPDIQERARGVAYPAHVFSRNKAACLCKPDIQERARGCVSRPCFSAATRLHACASRTSRSALGGLCHAHAFKRRVSGFRARVG